MFYEEIRIKQDLSYISICPLRILNNSKFILMASSLGTNAAVVTRVLTPFCFVVYSTRRFVVCLSVCHFVRMLFLVLLILRLPRLGKRELILVLFVRFMLVWICRFPLPLRVWEGLRFVIVALPGLFSYFFFSL